MKLKVGVVGLGRGRVYLDRFSEQTQAEVVAVCDADISRLEAADCPVDASRHTNYEEFLRHDLDIVVICTEMPQHAEHTIVALEGGKHVLCEVPAAYTLSECEAVVQAVEKTGLKYMLAENCCYSDMHLAWKEQIRAGELGKIIYAEAEYIHDCRGLMRRGDGTLTWRAKMPPIQYCTHSLGPLIFMMEDRCAAATGLNTGSNIAPDLGVIDLEVGLFQMKSGAVVKILCGFSIERYPAFHWYVVYGTQGALESNRQYKDIASGYFRGIAPDREMTPFTSDDSGHGVAESRIVDGFIESILNDTKPPIDVYEAMDYTAPGICAHLSAERDGAVVPVPNYR